MKQILEMGRYGTGAEGYRTGEVREVLEKWARYWSNGGGTGAGEEIQVK